MYDVRELCHCYNTYELFCDVRTSEVEVKTAIIHWYLDEFIVVFWVGSEVAL